MPRKKKIDRPVRKELKIPKSIADAVDEKLADRYTGRPIHGLWSELGSKLFADWLKSGEVTNIAPETQKKEWCTKCLTELPIDKPCNIEECPNVYRPHETDEEAGE